MFKLFLSLIISWEKAAGLLLATDGAKAPETEKHMIILTSLSLRHQYPIAFLLYGVGSLYKRQTSCPNTHVAKLHVRCTVWQVHWNLHMILCIQSIFRRPTTAKCNMPVCTNRGCQQSGMRQMWTGSGQIYCYSSERGRLSWGYCRGWLPHIPPVRCGEAEVGRDVWDGMRGMRRRVVRSRCAPPPPPFPSPFLNKSCSKSFYLHMLTGTSEFPEERCKEKKMERKREKEKELCPSLLQKA